MLSRFLSKPPRLFPLLNLFSSQTHHTYSKPSAGIPLLLKSGIGFNPKNVDFHLYSTKGGSGNSGDDDSTTSTSGLWKISSETDQTVESVFGEDDGSLEGLHDGNDDGIISGGEDKISGSFTGAAADMIGGVKDKFGGGGVSWETAEEFVPWSFGGEEIEEEDKDLLEAELEGRKMGLSGLGDNTDEVLGANEKSEEFQKLESEEKALTDVLRGPTRAFGDLIASSGITDEMLDSLIALQDFEGIQGLPPLSEIEERRYQKNTNKITRADIERQKQEEVAKARVRQVDDKGRAYATGRRKCSIARVWIQPGEGNFIVNDKVFDVYFPMLDHRAILLRPFTETKTLGMWDVNCTVKGGGTSGQVGAIRLGISKALQNWEPGFRPPLKAAGFLTRDSRVVERKKPGKAKARKSFQWVKR